jgi:hypothetical protein
MTFSSEPGASGLDRHRAPTTGDMAFTRSGDDVVDGLFFGLDAWQWHLFRIDPVADEPLL